MSGLGKSHRGALALLAVLAAGLAAAPARAGETHDELADEIWEGWDIFNHGASSGGSPTPPPPPPPSGGSTGGTATGGDGTTTDGGGGTATEPSTPPETDGGEPAPPEDDGEPDVADPGDPAPGGSPPPAPGPLPSCGAHWVATEIHPNPYLRTYATAFTNLIFRTDLYAFICSAYSRSESSIFLDWGSVRSTGGTAASTFQVSLDLVGACPNCNPRIEVTGFGRAEAAAQLKVLSWLHGIHPSSGGVARGTGAWAGAVSCPVNASAMVAGGAAGAPSGVSFGDVKIGIGGGGGAALAYDAVVAIGAVVIPGGSARVMVANTGASAATTCGDMENVQANAHVGYEIVLSGVTRCGAFGRYEVKLKESN